MGPRLRQRARRPWRRQRSCFHEKVLKRGKVTTDDQRYRNALFHLLTAETSCYRYWGQGIWTEYGKELSRRAAEIANHDYA